MSLEVETIGVLAGRGSKIKYLNLGAYVIGSPEVFLPMGEMAAVSHRAYFV